MSRRKYVEKVPDTDSCTAWKTEVRAKRRKFSTEFVSPKGGAWMYSADPFVDNVLRWIKEGASIECRTCGSLVYTLLTEDIVSGNLCNVLCMCLLHSTAPRTEPINRGCPASSGNPLRNYYPMTSTWVQALDKTDYVKLASQVSAR